MGGRVNQNQPGVFVVGMLLAAVVLFGGMATHQQRSRDFSFRHEIESLGG